MNIEIIRNTLYKTYLEDFYNFCQTLGDPTGTIMAEILKVYFHIETSLKPIAESLISQSIHLIQNCQKMIVLNCIQQLGCYILMGLLD
jgi:hypothetical protein